MAEYAYCGSWNAKTRKPLAGEDWLSPEEARSRYEGSVAAQFSVVDAGSTIPGAVSPFVIVFSKSLESLGVRTKFFNAAGSEWRAIDYKYIDGRLFKWIVREQTYPDDENYYKFDGATSYREATFLPDGHGSLGVDNKKPGEQPVLAEFRDIPVESYWLDVPAFGNWDQLADPDFGDTNAAE